ncbi:MAG TPA: hypothetical protein VKW08_13085 [Xanthobacteraceae bacterium]|jgi:hypothetical protein|nr:hypothetical protein [Xanthobacteraceae bacterium]
MFTKIKIGLCAAIVLGGAASTALASNENDSGNETGGYMVPGSMEGVNPVYHRDIFGQFATRAFGSASTSIQAHRARKKAVLH